MAIDTSPATVATSALNAIPFGTLIGAPLDACIQAQAQAAKTSWEFIRNVGLNVNPTTGEMSAVNVSFSYNKNGEMVALNVPLLTIVPIPFLAIDKVIIDFIANISASSSNVTETSSSEDISAGGKAQGSIGWGPFSLSFEASANYSSKKDSKASQQSQYSVEYTMNVHVEGGQSDMPAGLATVLNILQGSANEAPVGGGVRLSPEAANLPAVAGSKLYIEATAKSQNGVLQKGSKITFNLATAPTGMVLEPLEITRGVVDGTPTAETAVGTADDRGVVGMLIQVKSVDTNAYTRPGIMPLTVEAVVDAPADGQTTTVTGSASIRTLAAPNRPAVSNNMSANPTTATLAAGADTTVTITLKDDQGQGINGATVNASTGDDQVATVEASKSTAANGEAQFRITAATNAQSGDTTNVTFNGGGVTTRVAVTIS